MLLTWVIWVRGPMPQQLAGMAKMANALDLESRNLGVRVSLPVQYSTSPNGRGNSLKHCIVQVRLLGGVQ